MRLLFEREARESVVYQHTGERLHIFFERPTKERPSNPSYLFCIDGLCRVLKKSGLSVNLLVQSRQEVLRYL